MDNEPQPKQMGMTWQEWDRMVRWAEAQRLMRRHKGRLTQERAVWEARAAYCHRTPTIDDSGITVLPAWRLAGHDYSPDCPCTICANPIADGDIPW